MNTTRNSRMPIIGEKVKDSTVGPGTFTGWNTFLAPLVNGKEVHYMIMEKDGMAWDTTQDESSI